MMGLKARQSLKGPEAHRGALVVMPRAHEQHLSDNWQFNIQRTIFSHNVTYVYAVYRCIYTYMHQSCQRRRGPPMGHGQQESLSTNHGDPARLPLLWCVLRPIPCGGRLDKTWNWFIYTVKHRNDHSVLYSSRRVESPNV